jgi:hypothetical protein
VSKTWGVAVTVLATVAVAALVGRSGPYVGIFEHDQPHAHGHDDLVVRVERSPGMGTRESFFTQAPDLVLTGDGTVYAAAHEGPPSGIVESVLTFHVSEGQVQGLLKRAHHDDLLTDRATYPAPSDVMDGGTTSVVIATAARWTHRAYALEPGGWSPTARGRLADFVGAALRVAVGPGTPYRPRVLRMMAEPADGSGISEPVATWPSGLRVDLATVGDCALVHDPAVVRALTTRPEQYYREGRTTYEVAAAVALPGDPC